MSGPVVEPEPPRPGELFLASAGCLRGAITIADDSELTESEIDEMVDS